jgi:transposase-like protein
MAQKKRAKRTTPKQTTQSSDSSQPVRRWSKERKLEVVLRLMRGESLDAVSREVGVESYRLEKWREDALAGMKAGLGSTKKDGVQEQLDAALKRVGELTMDNELLQIRCRKSGVSPFVSRRSKP